MANQLDETLVNVTVKVYVNGVLFDSHSNEAVPAYAAAYVAQAAVVQVEDPDLEMARSCAEDHQD